MENNKVANLIKIALSDCDAARALYAASCYPQAYFMFQQAVEKGTKAIGLMLGTIDEQDLLKINHDAFKIHRRMNVESGNSVNDAMKNMELFPGVKSHPFAQMLDFNAAQGSIIQSRQFIDSLRNRDLKNIDEKMVEEILEIVTQYRSLIDGIRFDKTEIESALNQGIDFITAALATYDVPEIKNALATACKSEEVQAILQQNMVVAKDVSLNLHLVHNTLFLFGLLTIQHSSSTRYEGDDNVNPLEFYTKDFPPIKKLPQLLDLLKDVLTRLQRVQSMPDSSEGFS